MAREQCFVLQEVIRLEKDEVVYVNAVIKYHSATQQWLYFDPLEKTQPLG